MKRRNDDLWDFSSDPAFGKNSKDNNSTLNSSPDAEDKEFAEYADEYVDILRTKAAKSSSLDDMVFVMRDGKASFIDSTDLSLKPAAEVKEEKKAEPAPKPEAKAPAPAKPISEEKAETTITEDKEPEQPTSPTTNLQNELPPSPATKETESPTPVKEDIRKEEVSATKEPSPAKEPSSSSKSTIPEADTISHEKKSAKEPANKKAEAKHKEEPKKPAKEVTTPPISSAPAPSENAENSADTPKRATKLQNPNAKDEDDFIFAKPHSKKKSHSHHSSHTHSNEKANNSPLPEDNVDDYVYSRYRKRSSSSHHHHRKSSSSDYIRTKDNEDTTVVRSTTANRVRKNGSNGKRGKWKRRPLWQKLLIILAWATGILLVLALILFVLFLIFSRIGLNAMTDYEGAKIKAPTIQNVDVKVEDDGLIQVFNGKKYRLNTDIANILCIGVDKQNIYTNEEYDTKKGVGQSDALFMIALNTKTGETKVISIPRDTMADINIYDKNGKFLKTDILQICQAYAFGDGKVSSCENTMDAVSRLFYQLPIQTYFAMDLSAIAPINDSLNGVSVVLRDTFYDTNNIRHEAGEKLRLRGDNARKYLQYREVSDNQSTMDRLARQTDYLKAFSRKTLNLTKKDITTPITLFNVVSSNSISNLDVYRISGLARCLVDNGVTDLEFKSIPGRILETEEMQGTNENADDYYTPREFVVDEEAFYQLFLDTYYTPVK